MYHSTLGSRVIKKKRGLGVYGDDSYEDRRHERPDGTDLNLGQGFGVWNLGFGVQGFEFGVKGLGFRVWG